MGDQSVGMVGKSVAGRNEVLRSDLGAKLDKTITFFLPTAEGADILEALVH